MGALHRYETTTIWTGNRGSGTANPRAYDRSHATSSPGRPAIESSSDPAFSGDERRWNPELLLVAALSQCHMLSYLHRCSLAGVEVVDYRDEATAAMEETETGGHFVEAVLHPQVTVASAEMLSDAERLHHEASERCFIAASVNFEVRHEPEVAAASGAALA